MTFSGAGIDSLKAWVKSYVAEALSSQGGVLDAYPVGAIYVSTVATSPSELFGGTWEALEQGRVLIGQGTDYAAGSTGGEKEHAITTAEMPAHNHALSGSSSFSGSTGSSSSSHSHTVSALTPAEFGNWWSSNAMAGTNNNGDCGYPAFIGKQNENHGGWKYASRPDSQLASNLRDKNWYSVSSGGGSHSHTVSGTVTLSGNTGSKGSGEAVSLMQPYLAVYMWKRVA